MLCLVGLRPKTKIYYAANNISLRKHRCCEMKFLTLREKLLEGETSRVRLFINDITAYLAAFLYLDQIKVQQDLLLFADCMDWRPHTKILRIPCCRKKATFSFVSSAGTFPVMSGFLCPPPPKTALHLRSVWPQITAPIPLKRIGEELGHDPLPTKIYQSVYH